VQRGPRSACPSGTGGGVGGDIECDGCRRHNKALPGPASCQEREWIPRVSRAACGAR
jgi:hypothetical protein